MFSGRNKSIGCAVAWVTKARDSESGYPFYPVVQFCRIRAGHLWSQISSSLTKLSLSISNGSYCTCIIVGSKVVVTHLLPYIVTFPLCGQWTIQCSEPGCQLCISVDYYSTWPWNRLSNLSCGAIPQESCRSLIVSFPIGGEIKWQLFFESLNSFYCEMRLNKLRPSGRLV